MENFTIDQKTLDLLRRIQNNEANSANNNASFIQVQEEDKEMNEEDGQQQQQQHQEQGEEEEGVVVDDQEELGEVKWTDEVFVEEMKNYRCIQQVVLTKIVQKNSSLGES